MGHVDLDGLWHEASFRVVETYDVEMPPGWQIALDEQPYGEVFEIVSGRCAVALGEAEEVVEAGELCVLLPGPCRLTATADDAPLRFAGFGFRVQLFGATELSGLLGLPLRIPAPSATVTDGLAQTVRWGARPGPEAALRTRGHAELTVASLVDEHGDPRAPTGSVRREVADALRFMDQHAGTDLDVGIVAAQVHLSAKHFARMFASVVGVPPMSYLLALRLSRARAALTRGDAAIATVASEHGFADAAHFSRAFRRAYGCTPREARARAQHLLVPHSATTPRGPTSRPTTTPDATMVAVEPTGISTPTGGVL